MSKVCKKCQKDFPSTSEYFYKHPNMKDGLLSQCKKCCNERIKNQRKENPEYNNNYYSNNRGKYLNRSYGITLKVYNRMFREQKGICGICGRHQIEFKQRLSVDHNHRNGKIRGLLCHGCNHLLGYSRDNIFILIKMAKYLQKN